MTTTTMTPEELELLESNESTWFQHISRDAQIAYKKKHPHSRDGVDENYHNPMFTPDDDRVGMHRSNGDGTKEHAYVAVKKDKESGEMTRRTYGHTEDTRVHVGQVGHAVNHSNVGHLAKSDSSHDVLAHHLHSSFTPSKDGKISKDDHEHILNAMNKHSKHSDWQLHSSIKHTGDATATVHTD